MWFSIRHWETPEKSHLSYRWVFFVLWAQVFSLLAHREFWYMPSTPRGSVGPIFPMQWTFFRDCVTFVNFARSIGLKTLRSSVVSMKTSAARRPEAFLTNCHAYSTLPLNFSHFSLRLDCSSVWWCIRAHFLPNSWEDGVVQLPFRPALRLRLFSNTLLAPSFLSNLSSNYFPLSVSLKPETSWPFNSLNTLLLEER